MNISCVRSASRARSWHKFAGWREIELKLAIALVASTSALQGVPRAARQLKIPALTFLTDVPVGSPPLLAWCRPVAPLLRGPLVLLEEVHLYRWLQELKSLGARPLWPRLGLARKVGVESACAVSGVVPWGDLGAVGTLRWAWARALTISAPWNQLPCMLGVSADVLSDFLRLAAGGRKKRKETI